MFDFQSLDVYHKAKRQHLKIAELIKASSCMHRSAKDQLYRASLSIPLNIAEGAAKFSKPDKRNYYITARGSTYECASILEILSIENTLDLAELIGNYDELARMLWRLIESQR